MGRRKRINVLSLLVVHDILIVHIQSKYYISGRGRKVWGGVANYLELPNKLC